MKKFKFSLETVLDYKNQVLEELKREHSLILASIVKKQEEIAKLEADCARKNSEYNQKKKEGLPIQDAVSYESHLKVYHKTIEDQYKLLETLQKKAELKQLEVVAAKQEVSSYEKIKEKHLEAYNKVEQKAEEVFIDEFVSYKRSSSQ